MIVLQIQESEYFFLCVEGLFFHCVYTHGISMGIHFDLATVLRVLHPPTGVDMKTESTY